MLKPVSAELYCITLDQFTLHLKLLSELFEIPHFVQVFLFLCNSTPIVNCYCAKEPLGVLDIFILVSYCSNDMMMIDREKIVWQRPKQPKY